jgi:hypothetical protein
MNADQLSPMELASKAHHHSAVHALPTQRNQFNYCQTCREWFMPLGPGERVFCGIFPAGISWADRTVEEHGDYKVLAFLPYHSLVLEIRKGCPETLRPYIEQWANDVIAKRGQAFQVSTCGQTVTLGAQ